MGDFPQCKYFFAGRRAGSRQGLWPPGHDSPGPRGASLPEGGPCRIRPAMRAPSKFAAVTGLYNVRRDTVDGRGIDRYLGWLNRTVQLPLPFIVFLDPAIEPERVVLKPGDRLVRLPKDELRSYSWLPRVEE